MGAASAIAPQVARVLRGRADIKQVKNITAKIMQDNFISQTTICRTNVSQSQVVNVGATDAACKSYCQKAKENCTKNCSAPDPTTGIRTCQQDLMKDGTVIGTVPCSQCKENADGTFPNLTGTQEHKIDGITLKQEASVDSACIAKLSSTNTQQANINMQQLQEEMNSLFGSEDHTQLMNAISQVVQSTSLQQIIDNAEDISQKQEVNFCSQDGKPLSGSRVMQGPLFLSQESKVLSKTVNDLISNNRQWARVQTLVKQKAAKSTFSKVANWISIGITVLVVLFVLYYLAKHSGSKKE